MFQINLKNKKAIYEQVIDGIKEAIISEEYKPNDCLPSVREMSARLTVNPNTIQKAYSKLEQEGWIYTVTGKGAFVRECKKEPDPKQTNAIYEEIENLIARLKYLGEAKNAIFSRISSILKLDNERSEKW